MTARYVYLGDRWTAPRFVGAPCDPVRRPDGKCVLSVRTATALVEFPGGERAVVKRRRLRIADRRAHPRLNVSAPPSSHDVPEGR